MILTIQDVAERWGVDRRTAKKVIKKYIKYFKVGRVYRIHLDEIQKYEEGGTQ